MAANAVTDKGLYSESMNTVFAVTERSGRRVLLGVRFPPLKHGIVNDACHHPSVVSFASPQSPPPPPPTPRPLPPLSSSSPTPSPATHAHHVFCRTGRNRAEVFRPYPAARQSPVTGWRQGSGSVRHWSTGTAACRRVWQLTLKIHDYFLCLVAVVLVGWLRAGR